MNPLLLDEIVALCKRRVAQGDCPAEAAASVESLEDAVLQLSSYVLALAKAPADCDSKAPSPEPGAPERDAKKGSEQAGSTPDETLREALAEWRAASDLPGIDGARLAIAVRDFLARRALATPTKPEMQSVHPAAVSGKEET